jgi:hypothetical protein
MYQDKVIEKLKTHILCSVSFSKNRALYDTYIYIYIHIYIYIYIGLKKVWTSLVSAYCTLSVTSYSGWTPSTSAAFLRYR